MLKKFFRFVNIPGILLMALLFWSSSQSNLPGGWLIGSLDKVVHFGAYFVLAVSFSFWVRGERWRTNPHLYLLVVWTVCAAYGAFDEIHQSWVPNRHASLGDWVADVAEAAAGVFFYYKVGVYKFIDRLYFDRKDKATE
ncbi:MAG: VanZ family protein [Fibrobacter sp.]|nr:VanZ family protein [Fibrobacter sp.]